jgi:hypothetical protein
LAWKFQNGWNTRDEKTNAMAILQVTGAPRDGDSFLSAIGNVFRLKVEIRALIPFLCV